MEGLPSSSRPSLSEQSVSATRGPIPQFDMQLRMLNDSYLSFFQERKRIEETYIDSMYKLHRKTKSIDILFDGDRQEMSTSRAAWGEVRDNVERQAQARQAFVAALATDVILPLTNLKETQERTRKRIKEDLKESGNAYHDYGENALPKLKAKYHKKFAEMEEQKRQPNAPIHPQDASSALPGGGGARITSPQPLRAMDRRPSLGPPRNRSPPGGTAFYDLAHSGKRQLNQLMGFLDKNATVKEGLPGRGDQALRHVRTKRETEEADKEYRKGVHWLETLRLRRIRILESAYKSLEMFVEETSEVVKKVLEKYTDNLIATSTTETQLISLAHTMVNHISPKQDVKRLSVSIPRSLESSIPERVPYEHAQTGPCNDLIFGISLVDYATSKNLRDGEIPKIVKMCIREIDDRGLDCEGIYRVSGRHAVVLALRLDVEKDEEQFSFNRKTDDVYATGSLLKLYLRELPEPLFRFPLADRVQHTEDKADHQANNFSLLKGRIRRLPAVHQATLKALVEHLARVVAHSENNKMDSKNIAIVFGSVIFGEDEISKADDLLSMSSTKDTVIEDMITFVHEIFDTEEHPQQGGHKLPPTPAGELPSSVYYGSKTTKVVRVPQSHHAHSSSASSSIRRSPPITPPKSSQASPLQSASASPQDFTPRLPPRPANSIHPSARAGQSSPTKEHFEFLMKEPPPVPPPPFPARKISDLTISGHEPTRDAGHASSTCLATDRCAASGERSVSPTTPSVASASPVLSVPSNEPQISESRLPVTDDGSDVFVTPPRSETSSPSPSEHSMRPT